jgi:hypothetical protein
MAELKIHYARTRDFEPHYITHKETEAVAAQVRRELGLTAKRALTVDDLKQIDRLNVNGVAFDLWIDLEHQVHDDQQRPILGLFEFEPLSSVDAVSVCVSPLGPDMSAELQLSTFAHELGHAVFDAPALVARHQNQPLTALTPGGSVKAFRSVTESVSQLGKAGQGLPQHIRFSELRANEFMGSLLVPRDLLWELVEEEAPKHALKVTYGEPTLFAETLDGNKKIMWSPATYEMDCWSFTRALAPRFGVNPAFIDVRMMRYGIIESDNKLS